MSDVTRRQAIQVIGGAIAAAAVGCRSESDDPGACTLYPQQTEGPYYLDDDLVRANVTEGKLGTPLTLRVTVKNADCDPIAGALVDIWQCDAVGVYSGYPGQLGGVDTTGMTFLRGSQPTDANGVATFTTIYPGWYPGRTTHIHFKVHLSPTSEVTSQLYFPEDVTAAIYATGEYAARGQKDTSNENDLGDGAPLVAISQDGAGYLATIDVTVA